MSEPVASPKKDPFDLSSLGGLTDAQEEGASVEILHPGTGEPVGIKMQIAGPDSKRQKSAVALIVAERAEMRIRKITAARLEDEGIRTAAASIIGWSGVVENGSPIEYSPSAALSLLTKYPFIREQVQAYSVDRANFLKK